MVGLWLVVAAVAVDDVYDTPSTTTTTIVVVPETHAPTLAHSGSGGGSGDWVSERTLEYDAELTARNQVVLDAYSDAP
jgi:hypothetical protein